MGAEMMGKVLGDFIRGLYWIIGIGALVIVVLIGVIIWLVFF
jgi:hypothetical protein